MLSAYEYIVLLIAATCLMRRTFWGYAKWGVMASAVLASVCIVETVTLTTSLAAFVGVVALAVWNRSATKVIPLAIGGVGALGVVFFSLIATRYATQYGDGGGGGVLPHNAAFRIHVWVSQWLPVISHHILTGVGPTIPTAGVIWTSTESLYVTLLLRGGAPLLAAYAALMVVWFAAARRAAGARESALGGVGQVSVVAILLLIPMQLAEPYFVDTGLPHVLWALVGIACVYGAAERHRGGGEVGADADPSRELGPLVGSRRGWATPRCLGSEIRAFGGDDRRRSVVEGDAGTAGVPFCDLHGTNSAVKDAVLSDIGELIESGDFTNGSSVAAFESEFAAYCGAAASVGTSSGLDALRLSLLACGVGRGHEVLVPANTFFATFEAITQTGATPVPIDVSDSDYNMDVDAAGSAGTDRVRALLPVHMYGQLADIRSLRTLASTGVWWLSRMRVRRTEARETAYGRARLAMPPPLASTRVRT